MGFLNPGAGVLAVLAALIAAFYLWHFARRRQEVATFWLWQRALARRPAWFTARFWGSLIAQVVILLLLVAAMAQPYWKAALTARRTLVLVLDVSASTSAADVKPSRFAAMQTEAKRIALGLQPGEQMAILSAGSLIRTVSHFRSEPHKLLAAVDAVQPTDGATRVAEAVELARRMLDGQQNPRIVVLTDGCFPQATALASDELVQLKRFGQGGDNVAITHVAVRPDPVDPQTQGVCVETANYSEQPVKCTLTVALDKGETESMTLELAPSRVVQTTVPLAVSRGGLVSARLTANDDLPADNEARVFVASQQRPTVLFVPAGTPAPDEPLKAALEAIRGIDLQLVEQLPPTLPAHAVAVLHRRVPEQLPACPLLVITPQNACNLWEIAGTLREGAAGVPGARRDSLLTHVRFGDVVVEEAVKLEFKPSAEPLVETASGEALYSLVNRPEGPVLVLHVDLQREKSDLALRSDFSRLVRQAVRWLGGSADRFGRSEDTEAVVSVPPDKATRAAKSQDGRTLEVAGHSTALALDRVGVWEVPTDGGTAPPTPVNLASEQESNIRAGMNVPSREIQVAAEREQPLWMLLVGIAVVFLIAEWCLFHRRIVV